MACAGPTARQINASVARIDLGVNDDVMACDGPTARQINASVARIGFSRGAMCVESGGAAGFVASAFRLFSLCKTHFAMRLNFSGLTVIIIGQEEATTTSDTSTATLLHIRLPRQNSASTEFLDAAATRVSAAVVTGDARRTLNAISACAVRSSF